MTINPAMLSELTDDPLARGYAGMTDAEVADSLRRADIPQVGLLDAAPLRQRLVMMLAAPESGHALVLQHWRAVAAALPDFTQAAQVGRWQIANMLSAAYDASVAVNLGNADVMTAAEQAVALGLLSAEQLALLVADATRMISRAEVLGLGHVSHETVAEARRG